MSNDKEKDIKNDIEKETVKDPERTDDAVDKAEGMNKDTEEAGKSKTQGHADAQDEEPSKTGATESEPESSQAWEEGAEAAEPAADEADNKKPDKKDQKIAELNDKYVRLFAEFDNFRKRSETEKSMMFAEGEKTVLLKVLPLIDNFERAISTIPEEQKGTALAEGIEKVYRAFTDQLKELGVTRIEALGKEFDANLHNAVMHIDDEEQPENIIVEEFQKGYMFGDKVLRYSMVKVAN